MSRVLLIGLALLVTAPACTTGSETGTEDTGDATAEQSLSSSGSVNGIDVEATWLTPEAASSDVDLAQYPGDQYLFLDVQFNTHSGDLMSIEFPGSAEFHQAGSQLEPVAWISGSDDAHHRQGLLVVPREFEGGPVELQLRLNEDQLSLTWETGPRA